jgi:protein-tyrosine phosphatase
MLTEGHVSPCPAWGPGAFFRRLRSHVRRNHGTLRGWIRNELSNAEWLMGRLHDHTRLRPGSVDRLVFVCLGNINRSAFAAAVARACGARACSIGLSTTTGTPAFETSLAIATDHGIDLTGHSATDLLDYEFRHGDLMVAMEIRHVRRLAAAGIPLRSIVLLGYWATPRRMHLHDPHTLCLDYFRTCFTLLNSATVNLVNELRREKSPCIER